MQGQPHPYFVDERRLVREVHEEVEVGPKSIIAASHRPEDPRVARVVLGDEFVDRVAMAGQLVCERDLERTAEALQHRWAGGATSALVGGDVGLWHPRGTRQLRLAHARRLPALPDLHTHDR